MLKRLVCQAGRGAVAGARAAGVPPTSSAAAAVSTTIINAGAQHHGESVAWGGQQRRSMMMMSTRGGGGGKKKEPEKPLSVVLQEFEASLDANELRPLMAENAEELLQEATDAIPFAPGTRGSRRKKRHRERLRVVRRADYVKKLQGIAAHEKKMQQRSFAAINERLGKLGLSIKSKKAEREGTSAVV